MTSNFGTKAISIIIAIVLWVVVLGSRNVEVIKEVPLEVITSAETTVGNELPERIAFRLSGPKAFLRNILDRHDDPIRVNLSSNKPGVTNYRFFADNIRVPIGVKVLSISPMTIVVKLEPVKRRDVPVRLETRGKLQEGLRILHQSLVPATIRIKGPESRIDGVVEVPTLPVDLSGVTESLDREVGLDIASLGIQLEGPLPRLILDVEGGAPNFRIKNVDIRVVSSYKASVDQKSVTVLVRANPADLKDLDRTQIFAVADLSGKPKGKHLVPLKVTLPANLQLVRTIPDKVNVTLD